MKILIKALLAASMLMPVVAEAQDSGRDRTTRGAAGPWRQRTRPDQPPESRPVMVRPERLGSPASLSERRDRNDERSGGDRGRGVRGDTGGNPRTGPQPGFDRRPEYQQNRDNARDTDRRPIYAQDRRDRNDGRNPARNDGDDHQWDRGGREESRGGVWNRGWRNDSRYDWNRHRLANSGAYRLPRYYAPGGWNGGYRRFSIGTSLSSGLWSENYWIDDPWSYSLPEAYEPYRWVRYYDDALLVDLNSGRVIDSVYDIFD